MSGTLIFVDRLALGDRCRVPRCPAAACPRDARHGVQRRAGIVQMQPRQLPERLAFRGLGKQRRGLQPLDAQVGCDGG